MRYTTSRERIGLRVGPSVAGMSSRVLADATFEHSEAAPGSEDPSDFVETGFDILPVMDGGQRPRHRRPTVVDRQVLRCSDPPGDTLRSAPPGDSQHHRRRIDANDLGSDACGMTCGNTGPATDVDDTIGGSKTDKSGGKVGVAVSSAKEADRSGKPGKAPEASVVGVMVRYGKVFGWHGTTLTVEPNFKSSTVVTTLPEFLTSIGEVAERANVATSTLRYYERRGLVIADGRRSGHRQYSPETIRRLVFVQMLQEAGLTLDEIQAILESGDNAAWKAVAQHRLTALDADIARLIHARELLAASLLCRYNHPLEECKIMNSEIDRRLTHASP